MIYICSQKLYDMVAKEVTNQELTEEKLSLAGYIRRYFERLLNLPPGMITKVETKDG